MKKIFFIAVILGSVIAFAIEPSEKALEMFTAKVYTDNGDTLLYRLLTPQDPEEDRRYPLVLFLHGAGERGSDNRRQLIWGADHFLTQEHREKYPCYVLAPQCPAGSRWVDVNWDLPYHFMPEEPSLPMRLVTGLLEETLNALPVDRDRIYVTGLSMGGYGTWDIVSRMPERFAAAAPVCGGGDMQEAEKLTDIPVWAFHSVDDRTVPVERSRKMVMAIREAGGKCVRYTEYRDAGHGSWKRAYRDPGFFAWMFAQER